MVGLDNPRYFRHLTVHLHKPHINYIRTENCAYCKLARRQSYGNTFRTPSNLSTFETTPIDFENLRDDDVIIDLTNNRNNRQPTLISQERRNNTLAERRNNTLAERRNNTVTTTQELEQYPMVEYRRNGYNIISDNRDSLYLMQENIFHMRENHLNQIDDTLDINRNLLQNLNEFSRIIEEMEGLNYQNVRIQEQDLDEVEPKTTLEEINSFSKLDIYKYDKPEKCSICHDDINKNDIIRILYCSHYFHYKCVDTWLENKHQCPLCRTSII